MPYTKNYYAILNLPEPSSTTSSTTTPSISATQIRAQYRAALLAAHPDKNTEGAKGKYSVDDVKEAFTILSSPPQKREYDNWLRTQASSSRSAQQKESDFILGLEVLDLSDFNEVDVYASPGTTSGSDGSEDTGIEMEGVEWRRSCRCGHDTGFRIREGELEDAVKRGEKEVLVGCEGCSLWVRVGFEVEDDG